MVAKRPNSRRNLDLAIQREFGPGDAYVKARTVMSSAIVGQLLPEGAVKGGTAIKFRLGGGSTRFTSDLDVARAGSLEAFAAALSDSLARGWEGFSGRLAPREPPAPAGVPACYVMQPFDVKLSYNGKPWCTVPLEVGHDEIGDADDPDWGIAPDIAALFPRLGFPEPGPIPLMPLAHQVAQKLHALTGADDRVRDLVDLQLIAGQAGVDLEATRAACVRLFDYRKAQGWPPAVSAREGWAEAYAAQSGGLPVAPDVGGAIEWVNGLIDAIDAAG